eukprot:622506-Pyramimonas_sp.AAC.1
MPYSQPRGPSEIALDRAAEALRVEHAVVCAAFHGARRLSTRRPTEGFLDRGRCRASRRLGPPPRQEPFT